MLSQRGHCLLQSSWHPEQIAAALPGSSSKLQNGLARVPSSREALTRQPSSASKEPPLKSASSRTVLSQKAKKSSPNGSTPIPRVWSGPSPAVLSLDTPAEYSKAIPAELEPSLPAITLSASAKNTALSEGLKEATAPLSKPSKGAATASATALEQPFAMQKENIAQPTANTTAAKASAASSAAEVKPARTGQAAASPLSQPEIKSPQQRRDEISVKDAAVANSHKADDARSPQSNGSLIPATDSNLLLKVSNGPDSCASLHGAFLTQKLRSALTSQAAAYHP